MGAAGPVVPVVEILAAAAVLVPLSPVFAAATVGLLLLSRWVLHRTWLREAATEADGARGERRTAYWTELGTGHAVAKEIRIFGMGPWVTDRRRAEAESYLAPRWRRDRSLVRGQLLPAALCVAGGCLVIGVPAWTSATGQITAGDLARYVVAGLGLLSVLAGGQLASHRSCSTTSGSVTATGRRCWEG